MSIGVLKSICVDFSDESLYQYITVFSEEIYSRTIEITPLNNGEEYIIPIGTTARLEARKPDNKPILLDAKIDFTNNKIYLELTPRCIDTPGITSCQIGLYGVDNRFIASSYFYIDVYRTTLSGNGSVNCGCDNNVVESSPEYQSFRVALLSVDEVQKRANMAIEQINENTENANQATVSANEAAERANTEAKNAENATLKASSTEEKVSKNENVRITNEEARKTSETVRNAAEKARDAAEDIRKTKEDVRVANEEARIRAEAERVNNEKTRVDNENIRIENEGTRQALHEEMKTFFDGVKNVLTNKNVAQELGDDPEKVLSQKAATDTTHAIIKGVDVTNEEAQFIIKENENLHNPHTDHPEYLQANGKPSIILDGYGSSDFIKVIGINTLYVYTNAPIKYIGPFCVFYNANKEYIGFLSGSSLDYAVSECKCVIPINSDVVYVRFNFKNSEKYAIYSSDVGAYKDYKAHLENYLVDEFITQKVKQETEEIVKPFVRESIKNIGVKEQNCYAKIIDGKNAFISTERDNDTNYYLGIAPSQNNSFNYTHLRYGTNTVDIDNIQTVFNSMTLVRNMRDDVCPMYFTYGTSSSHVGGNHGILNANKITAECEISEVDIGSLWSDGTNEFYLYKVTGTSPKTLYFAHFDSYNSLNFIDGVTSLSHISGATHTTQINVISNTNEQFRGALGGISNRWIVDGEEVETYTGKWNNLEHLERYYINDPLSVCQYLAKNIGNNTNASVETLCDNPFAKVDIKRVFNRNGSITKYVNVVMLRNVKWLSHGVVQSGKFEGAVSTMYGYVPNLTESPLKLLTETYSFKKSDIAEEIIPYRFYMLNSDKTWGAADVYCPDIADGINANRNEKTGDNLGMFAGANNKMYPNLVSDISNTTPISISCVCAKIPYIVRDGLTNLSWYWVGDIVYLAIDAHENINKEIELPSYLNGYTVEVIDKSDTFTVVDSTIMNNSLYVNINDGYGYASLRLKK